MCWSVLNSLFHDVDATVYFSIYRSSVCFTDAVIMLDILCVYLAAVKTYYFLIYNCS